MRSSLILLMLHLIFRPFSVDAASLDPFLQAEEKKDPRHPILLAALRSQEVSKRLRAARAYGRMQTPAAREALQLLALDASPKVRAMALFGLGQLGWERDWTRGHYDSIKATLRRAVGDADAHVQQAAIEAIGKYAFIETDTWLAAFLKQPKRMLQVEALRALFRAAYLRQRRATQKSKKKRASLLSAKLFSLFSKLVQSPLASVRVEIAYFFARIKDVRALSLLQTLSKDADKETRLFALMGLRKLADPKGTDLALSATTSPHLEHRVSAIQALQAMKQVHRLPSTLAQDPSAHVRTAWAQAWNNIPSPPKEILTRLWEKDPSPNVRAAALITLGKWIDPEIFFLRLIKVLHQPNWILREATVAASKSLGWRRMTFLSMALQDTDVRIRSAALMALIPLKTKRVFGLLQRALRSNDLAERGAVVMLLATRKEPHAQKLAWTLYQQSLDEKWVELREELAGSFARKLSPQTTFYLRSMYRDPAPSVAKIAQAALQKRGIRLPLPPPKSRKPSPYRHQSLARNPFVLLETTRGKMLIECFAQDAPIHVATFIALVKKGFYKGLLWHRVIPNFVIQGGDPDGTGWGSGPFSLRAEINPHRFLRGTLGMPRAMGWDTGSVQLFLTHTSTPHLDGQYTVFGRLRKGFKTLDAIERGDRILRATVVPSP